MKELSESNGGEKMQTNEVDVEAAVATASGEQQQQTQDQEEGGHPSSQELADACLSKELRASQGTIHFFATKSPRNSATDNTGLAQPTAVIKQETARLRCDIMAASHDIHEKDSNLDGLAPVPQGSPLAGQRYLGAQVPGAVPIGPDVPDASLEQDSNAGDSPPSLPSRRNGEEPPLLMAGTSNDSSSPDGESLAEAQLVKSEAFAEALPAEEKANPEESRIRDGNRFKLMLLCGVVWVVAVVIVTASLLATRDTSSKASNSVAPTDVPLLPLDGGTQAPTFYTILDLPDYTMEVLQEDQDGTSPQAQAYQWLLNDPYLELYSQERRLQRFALAVFYYSTGGSGWTVQEIGTEQTPTTNSSQHLRGLQSPHGIPDPDGPLPYKPPSSLCSMEPPKGNVNKGNETQGGTTKQLPSGSSGGRCSNLGFGSKWLEYGYNNTSECDWYTRTESLDLHVCNEDHQIIRLAMSRNGLIGTLPKELAMLSALKTIDMAGNELTGTGLRNEWIESWSQIEQVVLLKNGLDSTIPTQIGLWNSSLRELRILANRFTGTVPTEIYSLSKLESLSLVDNGFFGTFRGDMLPKLQHLRDLELVANRFSGNLPTEIGQLTALENVAIHNNAFFGTLPTEMGLLTNVFFFSLGDNDFENTLPSELGLLDLDITFSVKDNPKLSGSIPMELGKKSIMNIYLQGTGLTGTIPQLWCDTAITLRWDCSDVLCGCDCPCTSKNTTQAGNAR